MRNGNRVWVRVRVRWLGLASWLGHMLGSGLWLYFAAMGKCSESRYPRMGMTNCQIGPNRTTSDPMGPNRTTIYIILSLHITLWTAYMQTAVHMHNIKLYFTYDCRQSQLNWRLLSLLYADRRQLTRQLSAINAGRSST